MWRGLKYARLTNKISYKYLQSIWYIMTPSCEPLKPGLYLPRFFQLWQNVAISHQTQRFSASRCDLLWWRPARKICRRTQWRCLCSQEIMPSNSVALPVQLRNHFRCLIWSFHLFYGSYCVQILKVGAMWKLVCQKRELARVVIGILWFVNGFAAKISHSVNDIGYKMVPSYARLLWQ